MYCAIHKDRTSLYHCSASSCGTVFNHVTADQSYTLNTVQSQLIILGWKLIVTKYYYALVSVHLCVLGGGGGGGGGG